MHNKNDQVVAETLKTLRDEGLRDLRKLEVLFDKLMEVAGGSEQ